MNTSSNRSVDDGDAWAETLPPFAALVAAMADVEDDDETGLGDSGLDEIRLALAIELSVHDGDGGRPRLGGSTPTQWTETTVMPVFHRLAMRIVRATDA